jgi:hypothetical protein
MKRHRLWKALLPTSVVLALLAALALGSQPALAKPTITVYKSPT